MVVAQKARVAKEKAEAAKYPTTVRASREDRQARIIEKARQQAKDFRGDDAAKVKRARAIIAKVDPAQQAKLAEQRARAERRRAQQPKLPFEKADRTASLKRLTDKSRVTSGKAGAANAAAKRAAVAKGEKPITSAAERAAAAVARNKRGSKSDREEAARVLRNKRKDYQNQKKLDEGLARYKNDPFKGRVRADQPLRAVAETKAKLDQARKKAKKEYGAAKVKAAKRAQAATAGGGTSTSPAPAQVQAQKQAALAALGPKPTNTNRGIGNDAPTTQWLARKAAIEVTHVPAVSPPPPAVVSRPISDPVRLKAEAEAMDRAIAVSPGARDNFVPVAAVRNAMPHLSRPEFDAVLNARRDRGEIGLDSHQGETRPLSNEEKAGAIRESGSLLTWLSRRDR